MWLWFNKSTGDIPNTGIIDLENFNRGLNGDPKKGQILYSAYVTERPRFEQFSRIAGQSRDRFFGFFNASNSGYDSDDDYHYIAKVKQMDGRTGSYERPLHPEMITKWQMQTSATIRAGNTGRGASFNGQPVTLNVFSKGTIATCWEEVIREEQVTDADGRVIEVRHHKEVVKHEQEWVDRVEFRLVFNGCLWAQWFVPGDTAWGGSGDSVVDCLFFTTTLKGGFFKPSVHITQTKPGVDPAFAMILSQLCTSEYSVAEVKRDLVPNTPAHPPPLVGFAWGLNGRSGSIPQVQFAGSFQPSW